MGRVRALSSNNTNLTIGDVWSFVVAAYDSEGYPADVTLVPTVVLPGGTTGTPVETRVTTGVYTYTYTPAAAGRHVASVSATDVGRADFVAYVNAVTTALGMPDLDEVREYLGETSATDAEVQDALDAEEQAQRDVCRVPPVYPMSLRQALKRRVARNLAMRGLPIPVLQGDAEIGSSSIVAPGSDPEVRRFERPWRKLGIG